jgi:membrane protein required for colicin V production
MEDLWTLDSLVLAVFGIAVVRGIWIGLIREGFSIAALGGGLLAVRYGTPPAASFIENASKGDLGPTVSIWVAGAVIGIGMIFVIGTIGKLLRRGAHSVGLGWADRVAGGVIGAAEGALAAGVILVATTWVVGANSPLVEDSKSIQILEGLQDYVAEHQDELPAVASPGKWLPTRK